MKHDGLWLTGGNSCWREKFAYGPSKRIISNILLNKQHLLLVSVKKASVIHLLFGSQDYNFSIGKVSPLIIEADVIILGQREENSSTTWSAFCCTNVGIGTYALRHTLKSALHQQKKKNVIERDSQQETKSWSLPPVFQHTTHPSVSKQPYCIQKWLNVNKSDCFLHIALIESMNASPSPPPLEIYCNINNSRSCFRTKDD